MKVTPASLLFLSLFFEDVCPKTMDVSEGEIVELRCPSYIDRKNNYANLIWTNHTGQEMDLIKSPPADGEREVSVLMDGRKLVFLSVSFSHEGNYSCSARNTSDRAWFKLTVHKKLSRHNPDMSRFSRECHEGQSCTLRCPDVSKILMPISNTTVWHKDNELLPTDDYFKSVNKKDSGVYTCSRSFLYHGRLYNMTHTVVLDVLSDKSTGQHPVITSPREKQVFHVDLGSPQVIDCKAVVYSDFDDVFWLIGNSFVGVNESLPVYYNITPNISSDHIKTASLIFKKVSEQDLLSNYTCKLESPSLTSNVTIFLVQRARPFPVFVILGTLGFIAMMVLTLSIIYIKLKIEITLFVRDTLGCHRNTSDGKSYDAYLMCYKSDTGAGLNEKDRRLLENTLEDEFGYNLCLYDRDVLPGEADAEAVLTCIEQSRRVVLIPTSPDPGPGSGLLNTIHEALVERQTRLVLIRTEMKEEPHSELQLASSLPEALQLLGEAGQSVTWAGQSSLAPGSSFWKQLRYHLPAPQLLKTMAVPTDNLSEC